MKAIKVNNQLDTCLNINLMKLWCLRPGLESIIRSDQVDIRNIIVIFIKTALTKAKVKVYNQLDTCLKDEFDEIMAVPPL